MRGCRIPTRQGSADLAARGFACASFDGRSRPVASGSGARVTADASHRRRRRPLLGVELGSGALEVEVGDGGRAGHLADGVAGEVAKLAVEEAFAAAQQHRNHGHMQLVNQPKGE